MAEAGLDQLARLWDEFRTLRFPPGFYQREPAGECMVMMDTMLAGCVSSAVNGPLDDRRRRPALPTQADTEGGLGWIVAVDSTVTCAHQYTAGPVKSSAPPAAHRAFTSAGSSCRGCP